jgi:hypothetical protein
MNMKESPADRYCFRGGIDGRMSTWPGGCGRMAMTDHDLGHILRASFQSRRTGIGAENPHRARHTC